MQKQVNNMSLTKFIEKNSDILTSTQDKNPMFYIFIAAKLRASNKCQNLDKNIEIKHLFDKIEKICDELGPTNIKILTNHFKPENIIEIFNRCTNIEYAIKEILISMKYELAILENTFSEAMKIEYIFKDLLESDEYKKFLGTL